MFRNTLSSLKTLCPNCNCELQLVRDSSSNFHTYTKDERLSCFICGSCYSFDVGSALPKLKPEAGRFCRICGRKFPQSSALKRHLAVHSSVRPFCCQECDKAFKTKAALKRHSIIHTGECPFECSTCKRRFNQISNLRKHLVIHSNNCPFFCRVCGKGFNQLCNMKKHLAVHGEEDFEEESPEEIRPISRPVLTFVKAAVS